MKRVLTHPLTIIVSCAAGIITGLYSNELTALIRPVGKVYLTVLNMCVMPIIICAIISSIGTLFNKTSKSHNARTMILLFFAFISLSCFTGIACSLGVIETLEIGDDLSETVGSLMVDNDARIGAGTGVGPTGANFQTVIYDITTTPPPETDHISGLSLFFEQLIPENIFEALASKKSLQILTFFLLFSIMLKYVSDEHRHLIVLISDAIFSIMQKLIDIIICFLPFGLWALLAKQFQDINVEFLLALGSFVVMVWIASVVILIVSTLFFWRATGLNPLRQALLLKAPILIALSTRSSFPTIPAALTALEDFGLDKGSTNLSVSLGHTLCKYGKSMVFCIGSVYSFYLYNIPVTFVDLASIFGYRSWREWQLQGLQALFPEL